MPKKSSWLISKGKASDFGAKAKAATTASSCQPEWKTRTTDKIKQKMEKMMMAMMTMMTMSTKNEYKQ